MSDIVLTLQDTSEKYLAGFFIVTRPPANTKNKPRRCDAAQGGVSPQIAFGKPDGTVNVKLGLIFNHEEHEAREENTKGKDIAPLGLICWLAIIGYKDYAPTGLSSSGKSGVGVNVMLRMAR